MWLLIAGIVLMFAGVAGVICGLMWWLVSGGARADRLGNWGLLLFLVGAAVVICVCVGMSVGAR